MVFVAWFSQVLRMRSQKKKFVISFAIKDRMLSGFPAIIFTTTENVDKVPKTFFNHWAMV